MPLEDPSPTGHSPAPPEFPQFQWGGLMLSGSENQDIRLSGRLRATAYASTHVGVTGDQMIHRHHVPPATAALKKYQEAVIHLREKIAQLRTTTQTNYDDALEVMGSVLLLTITGFPKNTPPGQAHDWSFHMTGMISVIQSMDRSVRESTSLGRLVTQMAAHLDIGAFSLGRLSRSKRAWLEWDICPPGTPPKPDFCAIEIIVGYPKSLLTIIATVSAVLEDVDLTKDGASLDGLVIGLYEQTPKGRDKLSSGSTFGRCVEISGHSATSRLDMLETVLTSWQPPIVPARISMPVTLALTSAWGIMRKAALLYLWRGGFCANVLSPMPPQRQQIALKFTHEMVLGFRALLDLAKQEQISIMNVMTWPLVIVANECGGSPDMQREVILLLERMDQHFGIEHLRQIATLLLKMWRRFDGEIETPGVSNSSDDYLSLDSLSREFGLCLPLL
ncbi:hypothetical protein ACHAP7_009535 [Fusarium lateritium]